ncbi:hypothetical protein [Acinetobacter sp. YH12086]|uniref:hypothetical protein n=1 Tax=Acinetobacter sp. YH12086 TaxID=2601078 RepID=UPI0015D2BE0D|nr:hypothetical protein [Acinetobacter sp. YH12086]
MFNIETQVGAKFKAIVKKGNRVTKESGWSNNLVLDAGLNRMSVGTWINRCCVGTGNSDPNAGQTMLDSFVASTTSPKNGLAVANTSVAPYYYGYRLTWVFAIGTATGNLSEVGLGWGDNNLWNRALLRDAAGNPTTITVLSDESLEIIAEVRCYPSATISGSFQLVDKNDVLISEHTYAGLPVIANASTGSFSRVELGYAAGISEYRNAMSSKDPMPTGITTLPLMYAIDTANGNTTTYPTPTSAKAVCTFPPSKANYAHKTLFLRNTLLADTGIGYKLEISPTISKTSLESLVYEFTLSWGRYEPT